MSKEVDHLGIYRLPWSLCDNGISWLEPTAQCNLCCDGCYRENREEHKSFDATLHELDIFDKFRRSDALSIAGGDPLLYPDILRTISEASRRGYKPVVNTNGAALTPELNRELGKAGMAGYTFHVDSKQGRRGIWEGKNEMELCALRDELAEFAAEIDVSCSFNATVYPDTLKYAVPLAKWAEDRMDKVQVMVFILYRDVVTKSFRYFNGDEEIKVAEEEQVKGEEVIERKRAEREQVVYNLDLEKEEKRHVSADEVILEMRRAFPDFRPSAYLNGTQDPSSFKWLLSSRIGRPGQTLGWVGPKFQELTQTVHHLLTDRYLAYAPRSSCRQGKATLLLSPLDDGVKSVAKNFLKSAITSPLKAVTQPLHFQTVLIIQPIDMMEDGRMNMCDSCPDITVHNDQLVWSCRMDELEKHGRNLWAEPREGLNKKEDKVVGSVADAVNRAANR